MFAKGSGKLVQLTNCLYAAMETLDANAQGITDTITNHLGWLAWLDQHHGVETDRTSVGIHG
jgi:hypothetical protein